MRVVLTILLILVFGYSLGLVLVNDSEVAVNLLFLKAPIMNLGLMLILCLGLGLLIGMLLALLLFRVLQNKWEISRLNKENTRLSKDLQQAKIAIDRQATAPSVDQPIFSDDSALLVKKETSVKS